MTIPMGPHQRRGRRRRRGKALVLCVVLAKMCAEENVRQKKWIYRFQFFVRWVHVSRRPWAGENLSYVDLIKDTRATVEGLTAAIETMRRLIEEDG